ncbi:MAG: RluA family pseudouridine synthase [Bacteroidia bacterium]|nr:RluA family pseudouridine synthase [Bacteroidia bacterium]
MNNFFPKNDIEDNLDDSLPDNIAELTAENAPAFNHLSDDSLIIAPTELGFYEHHRFTADPGQKPIRVDVYLTIFIQNATRSRIQNAIRAGLIRCNDTPVKASYKVKPGDVLTIFLPYPPAPDLAPENIPLDIVYEDTEFVIINKKAGMVCHPAFGHYSGTLVNALLFHLNQDFELDKTSVRPGLVHRIDKDTSGLLVIAKNIHSFNFLAKQFFEHTIERSYLAIVWGNVLQDSGTITGSIGRHPIFRKKFTVLPSDSMHGKHAVTHYEVLQRYHFFTLVRCRLETGRTHQIRVHFKHIGHTLLGDVLYGGDSLSNNRLHKNKQQLLRECLTIIQRQALHAKTLGFIHPTTRKYVQFNSAIPDDFMLVLKKIQDFAETINPEIIEQIAGFE